MTSLARFEPESYFCKPGSAIGLPGHLAPLLDHLLNERFGRGDPPYIDLTSREIADVCGRCQGHARRLAADLAARYPRIALEKPDRTVYRFRFLYLLKGRPTRDPVTLDSERSNTDPKPKPRPPKARRAPSKASANALGAASEGVPATSGAPSGTSGAPLKTAMARGVSPPRARDALDPPITLRSSNTEREELTLTPAPPELEPCAAPPEDGGTEAVETTADREARVTAYLNAMSLDDRKTIETEVFAANPGVRKFPNLVAPLIREAIESRHVDLFPKLPDPVERKPSAPPPPPRPDTEARRLFRIGDPTGPESIQAAVKGMVGLTGGQHMRPFFAGVLKDALARPDLADDLAACIDRAINPKIPLPPGIKSPDHYVTVSVMDLLRSEGLRPPPSRRPRP